MRRRSSASDNRAGYLFIAPWLIGFMAFTLVPFAVSFLLSFTRYDILSPPKSIGLQNYIDILFRDERFRTALSVTFIYVLVQVPLRLSFALAVAMAFKKPRLLSGLFRSIFYVPSVIGGSVAVAVMWRQLFGVEGAFNSLLRTLGIIRTGIGWIGDPDTALGTLIVLAVWQFGSPMLIFLAGLRQIPASLYEAAEIDGARKWRQFRSITIPALSPIIFFNFVMQTINGFKVFTQAYVITGGGPFDKTLFYALYVYEKSFKFYSMGYGAALSWILLAIIAAFTLLVFRSSSYWVFYESEVR